MGEKKKEERVFQTRIRERETTLKKRVRKMSTDLRTFNCYWYLSQGPKEEEKPASKVVIIL